MVDTVEVFVGNLSFSTDEAQLQELFEQYGAIKSKVVTDRETGRSRGFGFVTFNNQEDADKAIAELNDKEFDGRNIRVSAAQKKEKTSGGGGYNKRPRYENSGSEERSSKRPRYED